MEAHFISKIQEVAKLDNEQSTYIATEIINAMKEALVNLKNFEWLDDDLLFYFGQIEIKMSAAGVKKQFTKFQILATIIPRKVTEEVKPFLRKG